MYKLSWLDYFWLSWVVVGKNAVVWTHVIPECVLCPLWLLKGFHNASWGVENWERKDEFHFCSLCNNVCNTNMLRFLFLIFHLLCVWHARGSQDSSGEGSLLPLLCRFQESNSACQTASRWNLVSHLATPILVFWIWISLSVLPVSRISNQFLCILKTFFLFCFVFLPLMTQMLIICSSRELYHDHIVPKTSLIQSWLSGEVVSLGERGGQGLENNHILTGNVEIPNSRPKNAGFHRVYEAQESWCLSQHILGIHCPVLNRNHVCWGCPDSHSKLKMKCWRIPCPLPTTF